MRRGAEIDQTLHGYAEGHMLLATSTSLAKKDARAMLFLSDLAGSGGSIDEAGYLSGYPLPESGRYVLARTWLAPEMRRPGCVWTHSLIINPDVFDELPNLLLGHGMFRRPTLGRLDEYARPPVPASDVDSMLPIAGERLEVLRAMLSALYSQPNKGIYLSGNAAPFDDLVISIWAQQWPALRSRFRFCTSVAIERSQDGVLFDLQMVRKGIRNPASILKTALDARKLKITTAPWLHVAVEDLVGPSQDLARFFREAGRIVDDGRGAFAPLASLFCFAMGLEGITEDEAIASLNHPAVDGLPERIKLDAIKRAALASDGKWSQAVAIFLQHLDDYDDAEREHAAATLGPRLVRGNLARLLGMLNGSPAQKQFALRLIEKTKAPRLVEAAIADSDLVVELAKLRRDLLEDPIFIAAFPDINGLYALAGDLDERGRAFLVDALISSDRQNLDARRLRGLHPGAFWTSLERLLDKDDGAGRGFGLIRDVCYDIGSTTSDLATGCIASLKTLAPIAKLTGPDRILNDYGADPWLTALVNMRNGRNLDQQVYVMAFSFCRALGWRSRQPIELAVASFSTVYEAAKRNRLPDDARSLLDEKLADSYIRSWDMCKRMRKSVSELFIDKRPHPARYLALLKGDGDFSDLVEETADRYRGRWYLKEVQDFLEGQPNADRAKLYAVKQALG